MEDAIRARVPSLGNTRVVCRTGDPADLEDLTMSTSPVRGDRRLRRCSEMATRRW